MAFPSPQPSSSWLFAAHCVALAFLTGASAGAQAPAPPPAPAVSAQVAAIGTVEQVYASHRRAEGAPRPGARETLDASARASNVRRQCRALRELAGTPVTPRDLQEEMDRMVRNSKDPGRLQELFDALGGDPARVAEGLARPLLAERRLRAWYAFDTALHQETRRRAEASRGRFLAGWDQFEETDLVQTVLFRAEERRATGPCPEDQEAVVLSPEELRLLRARLPAPGSVGPIEETQDDFRFLQTLSSRPEEIEVRYVLFLKRGFSEWWE